MSEPRQSPSLEIPIATPKGDRQKQHWARAWWGLSLFLSLIGIAATRWQPDMLAALSLIPAWCWSAVLEAFYTIFNPRINEGATHPGSGAILISTVQFFDRQL